MLLNQEVTSHLNSWSHVFSEPIFTKDECCQILELCTTTLNIKTSLNYSREVTEARKSKNDFLYPTNDTKWIFEKINNFIEYVNSAYFRMNLIGYESIQYAEYDFCTKDKYDWHTDLMLGNRLEMTKHIPDILLTRKLSLSILLSDETTYKGGNFELHTQGEHKPININMKQGCAVVFPSYVFHRVTPMIAGTRKSLVVWVVGNNFV